MASAAPAVNGQQILGAAAIGDAGALTPELLVGAPAAGRRHALGLPLSIFVSLLQLFFFKKSEICCAF
eukprot:SAG31_NODE_2324_length_5941_cov_1.960801_5_plen_68_part_00